MTRWPSQEDGKRVSHLKQMVTPLLTTAATFSLHVVSFSQAYTVAMSGIVNVPIRSLTSRHDSLGPKLEEH